MMNASLDAVSTIIHWIQRPIMRLIPQRRPLRLNRGVNACHRGSFTESML